MSTVEVLWRWCHASSVSLSPVPPWDAFREIVAVVPRLPAEGTRRKRNLILEYLPFCSWVDFGNRPKKNRALTTDKEILIWPSKHYDWVFGAFINGINICYHVIVMLSPASWHYVINNHLKQNRRPRKSHFSNYQGKHIKCLLKPPLEEWKNIFLLAPQKKVASFGTSVVIFLPAVGRSRVSARHLQGPTIHM